MPTAYESDECCFTGSEVRLRDHFRLLWEQHVYWTRMVIMGIVFELPDLEQTTNRLLRNAPDFARVFCHFYGKKISSQFESLLSEHIVIAAELVEAAKAGKRKAVASAERRWYENAEEIVCFLHQINPNWSVKSMRNMWFTHLELTQAEAVAMLNKDYAGSIELFDKIEAEALLMADEFSNGIMCQFDL